MGQQITFFQKWVKQHALGFAILLMPLFALANSPVQIILSSTNVTCFGLNNGTATAIGTGGWAPYTYLWSTGATTSTITNLAPGTYSVTVTDIDLAFATATVTITQPNQLGVTTYGSSQICVTTPDGTATAVPFGGTPPYTYLWSTGASSAQVSGLAAGTYFVTVTDFRGCTAVGSTNVDIFGNEGIWIGDSTVNVVCFGQNNGMAIAMPMSGTAPYTYAWSNGGNTMKITNLAPGTYTVTVTDANGCFGTHIFNVTQPPALTVNKSATNALCTNNGTATVMPGGGTPPYSVLWNNGQSTFTITGLAPGSYSATVTDSKGCTQISGTVSVGGSNTTIGISFVSQIPAGCTIGGAATAAVANGSGNYTYLWSNGQTTAVATNLSVGNHTVTITDVTSGCSNSAVVNIPQATPIISTATVSTNATCATGGSATASATGGITPYSYTWSNGQTTQTATNLPAGVYTVTVRDATNCVSTATATVGQTQGPSVTLNITSSAGCTTGGTANVVATGGTAPYTYLWSNGQTTVSATNLPAGPVRVTVTDNNGCATIGTGTMISTQAHTVSAQISVQATCASGATATATPSGGVGPFSFQWSNGQTTATATNLTPGSYTVTVTGANGCTAAIGLTVAAPPVPSVVITASSAANCSQPGSATAMASGGVGPYTYRWTNNEMTATAVNLPPGTYTVTVTGANGCTATTSVTISQTNNGITIGDYVWFDNDQDGFQSPGEIASAGVAGVTVMLVRAGTDGVFGTSDDVTVATTTTNSSGLYSISCVTPGTYVLMFSGIPAGYEYSPKDNVNNNCLDSDVNPNGKTDAFTIVSGQGNNVCFDAGIHTICVNVVYPGQICCDQTICEGDTPALLTQVLAPSGGSGALEYLWMEYVAVGPAPPVWQAIPGATGVNYQPGPLTKTSYFMRCVRRAGCTTFAETNIVTITVLPAGSPGCGDFNQEMGVKVVGGTSVQVDWTTAPESEQYEYTIQHTTNQQDWTNVGSVMGKKNANAPNSYTYLHQTPQSGDNYYRISRRTVAGYVTVSDAVKIEIEVSGKAAVSIAPNPVVDRLVIKNVQKYEGDVTINITNASGVIMLSQTIAKNSLQLIEVPTTSLPAGIYFAQIRFADGDTRVVKLTKF
jgi:SdrD B-like domain/SprB repeat